MVSKINHGSNLYGALAYNQQKVDEGQGKILACNMVMEPPDGKFNAYTSAEDFERLMPSHKRTSKPVVHISLNPHPDDKLSDARLTEIAEKYLERLGYGGQPYMIFKHEDIERQHLHLVTTRIRQDGTPISDSNEKRRSKDIIEALEAEYKLIPAKGQKQSEAWRLNPVDASGGKLKAQVAGVIKPLSEMYRFQSLAEYRALLSLYNIGIQKVEGSNAGQNYTGLVYSALDGESNRVGKPLKSSLFGKKQGIGHLEQVMKRSGEAIKSGRVADSTKAAVTVALKSSRTENELRVALRKKGIDVVLRRNDSGRIYGATFIDHNTRTVLNGSRMGKEFSANALHQRFADNSPREDLQKSTAKKSRPQPTSKLPTPGLADVSQSAGGLLSVVTPEQGGNDNQPPPSRRRKKKRRYGRQM